jgi:hypothetical protein
MGSVRAVVVAGVLVAWGCAAGGTAAAVDHGVSFPTGAAPAPYTPGAVEAAVGDTVTFGGAFATPDFTWSVSGATATFTPTAFTDPDGSVVRYEWDLDGDGVFEASGASVVRGYGAAGTTAQSGCATSMMDTRPQRSRGTR